MKILKLNLTAFGPFTDVSLDLSNDQKGLNIIYGPNEAGKSSSLRAIADFFYGIHAQTSEDFIHPYKKLRIGAQLRHSDGTVLDLLRRKANQNSIRLSDDITPLDERKLHRFLGDVDRNLFQSMFGITHERLRRGGSEIVKGGGPIGAMLFAAGAGLTNLQQVQTQLRDEIDKLFSPSGKSGSIPADVMSFKDIQSSVKELQVSVETWRRHDDAIRSAKKLKDGLDAEIRTQRSEQNRLTRIRNAFSAIQRRRNAIKDLADVCHVPLLPKDFSDTSNAILIELRRVEQQLEDAETTIREINDELDTVSIPEELLRESEAIESFRDRLGVHVKAMQDRPMLSTSRELSEGEATEILRKLGHPADLSKIEKLRLPADKTVRIQNLGNQHEGLFERLLSARRDCQRLRSKISDGEKKLSDLVVPSEANRLQSCVRDIQTEGDLESQLCVVQNSLQSMERDADVLLHRLSLWSGSLDEIELLPVPSETTIERFCDELNESDRELKTLSERLREATKSKEDLEWQLRQLEVEQRIPTKDELAAIRRWREQGWQLLLRAWQDGHESGEEVAAFVHAFAPVKSLSDTYHRTVEESDQIADLLRSDADRVAMKLKLQLDQERAVDRQTAIVAEIRKAEVELQEIGDRWQALWEPIGIKPLTPPEMRDWLRQQQEISRASKHIRAKRDEANQLLLQINALRNKLISTIRLIEPKFANRDGTLRELLLFASALNDTIREAKSQLKGIMESLVSDRSDLAAAEVQFADCEAAITKWKSAWATEMDRLGLEVDAAPSQANCVLTATIELFRKYQEADQFRTRIEGIDREAHEFEEEVREFTGRIAPTLATNSIHETVSLLTKQLQAARSAAENHASLTQRRNEQLEKLQTAKARISEFNASLGEMCRQAACVAHDQLSEAARQSDRRRELEGSIRELDEQILSQCGGADLDAFVVEAEKEAVDIDSLAPRIEEIDDLIQRFANERDDLIREIEREETESKKIDGKALAAEKADQGESITSHLEDQVQQLAVLRVASAVLHAGIEQHRKKNEDPVLVRASSIFNKITLGAFERLRADFNERGEPILAGIRTSNGEAIPVTGMSDGTCDQLYLAIRIASLEAWLDQHEPLPFIVDDVLLNFDDDRAVACLNVLGELSQRTQVIFFTHHDHLVQLAATAVSSDRLSIVRLPTD